MKHRIYHNPSEHSPMSDQREIWDKYYSSLGYSKNDTMWYSENDVEKIKNKLGVYDEYAKFIWRRTEHSVRTFEILENYIRDEDKILEIGCGQGTFTLAFLKRFLNVKSTLFSTDFSSVGVVITNKRINENGFNDRCMVIQEDATILPHKDQSFDVVILPSVIEHIPDQKTVIDEIYRVCKPTGIILISTDNKYGQISRLSLSTMKMWGKGMFRKIGLSEPGNECISADPKRFTERLRDKGLKMVHFEFTHFSIPFFSLVNDFVSIFPKILQGGILNLLKLLERKSRESKRGYLHPMFIAVCQK